jgi:hypothetical protein
MTSSPNIKINYIIKRQGKRTRTNLGSQKEEKNAKVFLIVQPSPVCNVSISARTPSTLTEGFHGFPQYLHDNVETVL